MTVIKFSLGDILLMKKRHPCSSDKFKVIRVGSDVRILCLCCGRDIVLPRRTIEKSIKKVIHSENEE